MHLINIIDEAGEPALIGKISGDYNYVNGVHSILELGKLASANNKTIEDQAIIQTFGAKADIDEIIQNKRFIPILGFQNPNQIFLTGTGLTHLGSAEGRDKMHKSASQATDNITDSMKMFLMGVENGKPKNGDIGAQPEWFYKGNGNTLVGAFDALISPWFALDGGEEPEIAGIYFVDEESNVNRLGFALANEFSDHIVEKGNYLWLAHSKLRNAALGFELITGELPLGIIGMSKIIRGADTIWEKQFLSGENNMSHSIENLEFHHFKYDLFRKQGDFHVHFFGTATASFADGIETQDGDIFEINADAFDFAISNQLVKISHKDIKINRM